VALLSGLLCALSACAAAPSTLHPQGPAAARLAQFWWALLTVATIVFVIVIGLIVYALFRHRRRNADGSIEDGGIGDGRSFITIGGAVVPALVLVGVMIYTVDVQNAISMPASPALTVQLIGHQWWWEVAYPDQGITTANEIHIPVGQPVAIKLTSADVIHSFWVPELQAKMDLIPGQTNSTWIQADHPGVYRAECAEFCGLQHAHMSLLIVAESQDQVNAWIANEQKPAVEPTAAAMQEGQQVFYSSACVYCHTIRGTLASGKIGPDLTHIASRRSLGAGMLDNNIGNLSGWIVNSQAVKPGNQMPPMYLSAEELATLRAYLMSLK
jgi:cytochrome c oxidase subunit 2